MQVHTHRPMNLCGFLFLLFLAFAGSVRADTYTVSGSQILKNGLPVALGGVNAFGVNGPNAGSMSGWSVGIVREPIGDMSETSIGKPTDSGAYKVASNGSPLHALQDVVNDNRAHGMVTILCPFQWTPTSGQFSGLNPSAQSYYSAYKAKLKLIAQQFVSQPDVWIETWNEPYAKDNDPKWLSDMEDAVDTIRSSGNGNIVLVPGCNYGSSESIILSQGNNLLLGRSNIAFDLHGYTWEPNTQASTVSRIQNIRSKGFALVFGECGPGTASGLANPQAYLSAALSQNVTTLAWDWNYSNTDSNSLHNSQNAPNNNNNFNWATTFQSFLTAMLAQDVSKSVSVTRGGFSYRRATGHYFQQIMLTNTGSTTLAGSFSLVLGGLTGASLASVADATQYVLPANSPYVSASGGNLGPGATVSVVLEFAAHPTGYTTRILAGQGSR